MTISSGLNNFGTDNPAQVPAIRKEKEGSEVSDVQEKLLRMWQELLPEENVDVDIDFNSLGGDSIFAMRVISLVWDTFSVELSPGMLFDLSNIESLAQFIADKMAMPAN